jgi:hypothetical protein
MLCRSGSSRKTVLKELGYGGSWMACAMATSLRIVAAHARAGANVAYPAETGANVGAAAHLNKEINRDQEDRKS